MSSNFIQGPGEKPTKKNDPIEPEREPEEPTAPDWDIPITGE